MYVCVCMNNTCIPRACVLCLLGAGEGRRGRGGGRGKKKKEISRRRTSAGMKKRGDDGPFFFFSFSFELALSRYSRTFSRSRHTLVLRTLWDAPLRKRRERRPVFGAPCPHRSPRRSPVVRRAMVHVTHVRATSDRWSTPARFASSRRVSLSIISINATTESGDAVPTF